MPALAAYSADLDYAYAPGLFPSMECLLHCPERARRLLLHSSAAGREGADKLTALAETHHVRIEIADRALQRISGKENCFAAVVFSKEEAKLCSEKPHVVLHHPSDCGNVGTILRTALGFEVEDVALIRPCVDVYDPRVVRASMGSIFQLRIATMESFEAYQTAYGDRPMFPFMLDGSRSLPDVLQDDFAPNWSLIFGNEGSGLPAAFSQIGQPVRIPSSLRVDSLNLSIAAGIGIYSFMQAKK